MGEVEVVWVIVSYGTPDRAVQLGRTVREIGHCRVVVACNGLTDFDGATAIVSPKDGLHLVDFADNPGYMGALRRVAKTLPTTAIVILSNADLVVDRGFFAALHEAVLRYPDAGMFAPSIVGSTGDDQNPHLVRPPTKTKLTLLKWMHRYPRVADLLNLRRRGQSARSTVGRPGDAIFAGHGSCLVFLPEYRRRGGRFDYPCFLFGEELWVGFECRRVGLAVHYIPELKMRHEEHISTGTRRRGSVARAKYESLSYWVSAVDSPARNRAVP